MSPIYIDNPGINYLDNNVSQIQIAKEIGYEQLGVLDKLSDIIIMPEDIKKLDEKIKIILSEIRDYKEGKIEDKQLLFSYINQISSLVIKKINYEYNDKIYEDKVLKREVVNNIENIVNEIKIEELNINTSRIVITQILDLIGYNFKIIKNNDGIIQDDIGNISGISKSAINGPYNESYGIIYDTGFFSNELTILKNESYIELFKKNDKIKKFDTKNEDISKLEESLKMYGKVDYIDNGIKQGPVLVIFPEVHSKEGIYDNYLAVINNYDSFNFLATETLPYKEIKSEIIKNNSKFDRISRNKSFIEEAIKKGKFNISSIAIELLLGEKIKTIGIDVENINNLNDIWKNLDNKPTFKKKHSTSITMFDEANDYCIGNNDFFCNVLGKYRENTWFNNIHEELLKGDNSQGKNFIAIICGGAHAKGLIEKSNSYGFKGILYFRGNELFETTR